MESGTLFLKYFSPDHVMKDLIVLKKRKKQGEGFRPYVILQMAMSVNGAEWFTQWYIAFL